MSAPPTLNSAEQRLARKLQATLSSSRASFTDDGGFASPEGKLNQRQVVMAMKQFDAWDVDRDGVVSFTDFVTAMSRHDPSLAHPSKRPQLEGMYATVDVGGMGSVDAVDFLLMYIRKEVAASLSSRCGGASDRGSSERRTPARRDDDRGGGGAASSGLERVAAVSPSAAPPLRFLDLRMIAKAVREDGGGDDVGWDIESGSGSGSGSGGLSSRSYQSAQSSLTGSASASSDPGAGRLGVFRLLFIRLSDCLDTF